MGKAWGVNPPWHECRDMARCIWHFQGAEWHSKIAKWHSSCAMWHPLQPLHIYAISSNFVLLDIFLRLLNIQKVFFFFLAKLRHFDVSNSLVFKNHHLHHCFQKLIKSSFFLRLMVLCSKLGAFAHGSFIFKKEKKNHHNQDFQKSCIHFKLGAFGFTSFK